MDKVYENFNKTILFRLNHRELFNFNITKLLEIYDKGAVLLMTKRNEYGQRILIIRHKLFDELKIDINDIIKIILLVSGALENEAETQICGLVLIMDYREISMRYMTIIDPNSYANFVKYFESAGIRVKQVDIVGLPAIANTFLELLKSLLSQKLQNRMKICKNIEDMTNVKNLTVEYGGTENVNECLKYFREKVKESEVIMTKLNKSIEIDEKKMRNYENEKIFDSVGSFRKLEID
ncbi:alpha-tocopherol transfer protein-like [Chironomus tepperi]|uniref:alpha-tocopherol transfer protein-like n=1 Tax=Chironomus tepperi TaxID=113505 RepID=UPI00391FC625